MANNVLQQVQTYNKSGLATLQNMYCFLNVANMKFDGFEKMEKNLGSSVGIRLPSRMTATKSLVAGFQGVEDRELVLTVDEPFSVSYDFTAQEFIFNADRFMEEYGRTAMSEIGAEIESSIAKVAETNTYRFYGDGVNQISNFSQLDLALEQFRSYGAARNDTVGILDPFTKSRVCNSGANQFVVDRNEQMMKSWLIGDFNNTSWKTSNLLPLHVAGTEGQQSSVLTVVSVTKNAAGGVTAITFSGTNAANDADSIKAYDKLMFSDGVAGQDDVRFLTFTGHKPSQLNVQFRAEADAASDGANQVTVQCYPALQAAAGRDQNITREITAGMQVTVLPNHRCGLIMAGKPLYVAMPRLPDQRPYDTSVETDRESGVSMRLTHGARLGQNSMGMIHDCILGKTLADEYAMMIAIPE